MHFSLSLALSAADIGSVFCNSEESPLKGLRLLAIKFAGEIFHIAFRTVSRTTSLTLNIYFTCLQIFQFLNKAVGAGEPVVIKNAICLHEEDSGTSWKHTDHHSGCAAALEEQGLVFRV